MSDPSAPSLGGLIAQITIANGETEPFVVRVPEEGSPQYIYDSDPDNPVDVPSDIVAQARGLAAESSNV